MSEKKKRMEPSTAEIIEWSHVHNRTPKTTRKPGKGNNEKNIIIVARIHASNSKYGLQYGIIHTIYGFIYRL